MARFYFHPCDDGERVEDPEGSELPDLAAAREEAIEAARHLWAAAVLAGQDIGTKRFEIADEGGVCLLAVPFDDALSPMLLHRLRGKRG